jgi:hypothetical protein
MSVEFVDGRPNFENFLTPRTNVKNNYKPPNPPKPLKKDEAKADAKRKRSHDEPAWEKVKKEVPKKRKVEKVFRYSIFLFPSLIYIHSDISVAVTTVEPEHTYSVPKYVSTFLNDMFYTGNLARHATGGDRGRVQWTMIPTRGTRKDRRYSPAIPFSKIKTPKF